MLDSVSGGEPRERWDALDLDAFPSPSRRGSRIWVVVVVFFAVVVAGGWAWLLLAD
jgi:hypothetical protein